MKEIRGIDRSRGLRMAAFALAAVFCFGLSASQAQDLKAPDIIQKHLDSIGTAEARAQKKNYFVTGQSAFASKLPSKKTGGKSLFVSEGDQLFVLASFMSQEYPFEKIGYFNGSTSLPFVTSGARSPLGAFISDHPSMLSHGLFTGAMSTNWALLKGDKMQGRVQATGSKKVDGKKAYVVDYFPGTGSEFTIKMFFDAETFRHIRTEYKHVIPPQPEKFGQLGAQTGVKLTVVETFADFKTVDGMTLPYSYKINYQTDSNSGVYEYDWGFTVQEYFFNQKLQPDFFTFDAKPAEK